MKLSVTHYNHTITIETEHDDIDLPAMIEHIRSLLLAMGYSSNGVEEALGE